MVIIEDSAGGSGTLRFPGNKGDVISRYVLATAIQRSFLEKNIEGSIENKVAEEMAEHVLNFFGFGERIIDNMLKTDDRDIFYMLEDLGILKTEREETTLYDGREWRINYWTLKKQFIATLTDGVDIGTLGLRRGGDGMDEEELYGDLPDDFWSRDEGS